MSPDILRKVKAWLARKRWRRIIAAVRCANVLEARLRGLRAFRAFRRAAVTCLIINCTWMKLARRVKRNRAARKIQATFRMWYIRTEFLEMRSAAILMQSAVRMWRARVEYGPALDALAAERAQREEEEKELLAEAAAEEREERKRAALEARKKRQEEQAEAVRRARERAEGKTASPPPESPAPAGEVRAKMGYSPEAIVTEAPVQAAAIVSEEREEQLLDVIRQLQMTLAREIAARRELALTVMHLQDALVAAKIIEKPHGPPPGTGIDPVAPQRAAGGRTSRSSSLASGDGVVQVAMPKPQRSRVQTAVPRLARRPSASLRSLSGDSSDHKNKVVLRRARSQVCTPLWVYFVFASSDTAVSCSLYPTQRRRDATCCRARGPTRRRAWAGTASPARP